MNIEFCVIDVGCPVFLSITGIYTCNCYTNKSTLIGECAHMCTVLANTCTCTCTCTVGQSVEHLPRMQDVTSNGFESHQKTSLKITGCFGCACMHLPCFVIHARWHSPSVHVHTCTYTVRLAVPFLDLDRGYPLPDIGQVERNQGIQRSCRSEEQA